MPFNNTTPFCYTYSRRQSFHDDVRVVVVHTSMDLDDCPRRSRLDRIRAGLAGRVRLSRYREMAARDYRFRWRRALRAQCFFYAANRITT